jgi:hypothetical protein
MADFLNDSESRDALANRHSVVDLMGVAILNRTIRFRIFQTKNGLSIITQTTWFHYQATWF